MSSATMLAAVYEPGSTSLCLDGAYPIPKPGPGQVLLRVAASGVCQSDVNILRSNDQRKYIMGHEVCGFAVGHGPGVNTKQIRPGQLYVAHLATCVYGLPGSVPTNMNLPGLGLDGGFAEFTCVDQSLLIPVPTGIPPDVAVVAADAGATAFHAVNDIAKIHPGSNTRVLLIGIGGVGHLALQYARILGATVFACDVKPSARSLARELGATCVFDSEDLKNAINAGLNVDVVIDFVGTNQTLNQAIAALKPNAHRRSGPTKAILIGATSENLTFDPMEMVKYKIQLMSNVHGSRKSVEAALSLFGKGIVTAKIIALPLEEVNDLLFCLRESPYTGRRVLLPRSR